jgi:exosortase/archaeosortase family protein
MEEKEYYFVKLFFRYLILVVFGLPFLWVFDKFFLPLTIYPVFWLLSIFFNSSIIGNTVLVNHISINIINACVAGSAYYLLLILNLSTPEIKLTRRIYLIFFSFFSFLVVNILRIFFLTLLFISNSNLFNFMHEFFWYFLSIFFVIGIWFIGIKLARIKAVPFYSDLKYIYGISIFKKKN